MKKILIPILFYFSLPAFSQTKTNPLKIKYNANWEVISSGTPYYISKAWEEGDKWHKQDFYYRDEKLQMDGYYADDEFKKKDGQFTWYFQNGQISISGQFSKNKKEGIETTFFEDGKKAAVYHYKNDLPVDSCTNWFPNGNISTLLVADKAGNGTQSDYYDDGKLRFYGSLKEGKKTGNWLVYDGNGAKMMQLQYHADSLTATTCVDAQGKPVGGNCIYEKPAEFKGGANGWRRFLEQNLEYPNYAQKKNIQGVVRVQFLVSKTGDVSEVAILSSPHESLSKEVLRLMGMSPKWLPAIQLNKPVLYRHIQSVTFRLE